jgi:hypothetical protein
MLSFMAFEYSYGAARRVQEALMTKKAFTILASLVCLTCAPRSIFGAPSPHFGNVVEALQAAHEAPDQKTRRSALAAASQMALQSEQEMQALMSSLDGLAVQAGHADDPTNLAIVQEAHAIGNSISLSTSPALQPIVSQWLDKEVDRLPAGFADPDSAQSPAQSARALCVYERINSLLRATEGGKNAFALAAVRKLAQKGGFATSLASRALGTLGDSTDLDYLIETVKRDPHAQMDLSGFGPPVVDRILQEVNNPAVTPDVKNRLTVFMSVVSRHDLLPKYQSLLRSNNPAVVHAAAIGMYRSLTPADSGLVQAMLKDPSDSVRVQALTAIQTKRIWIDSFGADLIQILHSDPNDIVRSQATALLGIHHVLSAESDLTKALQDRSMFVRQAAQYALTKLKG